MTALAEALLAAQRQAIGALAKPYVAGVIDAEQVTARLSEVGLNDPTDTAQLLAAWDVLREYGAPAPRATQEQPKVKAQTPAQRKFIVDLFRKGEIEPLPDIELDALNFERSSALIEALKNPGSFDRDEWLIPF